jgi:hypothetical protein
VGGCCEPLNSWQVIPNLTDPTALAVDDTNVYWSDIAGINTAPKTGGTVTNLSSTGGAFIVLDDTSVYWAAGGNALSVGKTGGTVSTLGSVSGTAGLGVDTTNLYWAAGLTAYAMPKTGGSSTALYTLTMSGLGHVGVAGLALDGTSIYVTADSEFCTVSTTGGGSCVGGGIGPQYLLISESAFGPAWYASSPGGSSINGSAPVPSAFSSLAIPPVAGPAAFYAADSATGEISAFGGTPWPVPLFGGPSSPVALAVDDTYLYWADAGGWIGRVPLCGCGL